MASRAIHPGEHLAEELDVLDMSAAELARRLKVPTNRVTGMKRNALLRLVMIALFSSVGLAFQAGTDGPYKVLKTARVGGEGGTDYIFADTEGRRLYITRGATQARAATDTMPAVPAFE